MSMKVKGCFNYIKGIGQPKKPCPWPTGLVLYRDLCHGAYGNNAGDCSIFLNGVYHMIYLYVDIRSPILSPCMTGGGGITLTTLQPCRYQLLCNRGQHYAPYRISCVIRHYAPVVGWGVGGGEEQVHNVDYDPGDKR